MLFTSLLEWGLFAVLVAVFWALPSRFRVPWLAVSSLLLLTLSDFVAALVLVVVGAWALLAPAWVLRREAGRPRRLWIAAALLLSPLLFFKYARGGGPAAGLPGADALMLPVGISYFTIKALMFLIDASQGRLERPRLSQWAAYLALAPAASAGPIDPPARLLPQLAAGPRPAAADLAHGLLRITVGFAMKFVVADALLRVLGDYRAELIAVSLRKLLLFGPLYALMIYCDFAGYSHIAIGAASLLGLRCTENFAAPYLKGNITDFWRSWHMSLTGFLRRYVFLPLAYRGSRSLNVDLASYVATFLTFVLCGIWHGAGWNFVLWGAYHGILLSGHQLFVRWARRRRRVQRLRRTIWFGWAATAVTFGAVCLGWYLFAFDMHQLLIILHGSWR